MCPSLPLGRREREMEVEGSVPQGTLMGKAPGDSSCGTFFQPRLPLPGCGVDIKDSHSEVGRWPRAKELFQKDAEGKRARSPTD